MAQGSQAGGASNVVTSLGIPFAPHRVSADYVLTVTCRDQPGIAHSRLQNQSAGLDYGFAIQS
jgi:hypothetical protein